METTYAKLLQPAGLSQIRGIVKAKIDKTPTGIFMRTLWVINPERIPIWAVPAVQHS